jgi:hypothetical protein
VYYFDLFDLKLVRLIRVCVSEIYSGVIFIVRNGLNKGDNLVIL